MNNQPDSLGVLWELDTASVVGLSVVFAFLIVVLVLVVVVSWAVRKYGDKEYTFIDIIYDAKGFPSLSKFQFLVWTIIISFLFAVVAFIRILSGTLDSPVVIPENLIYLLGISIGVIPVASYISKDKYGESLKTSNETEMIVNSKKQIEYLEDQLEVERARARGRRRKPSVQQPPPYSPPKKRIRKNFWTMLMEGGIPSLTKFQMFTWTWIAVGIYVLTFLRIIGGFVSGTITDVSSVVLPDVSFTLVVLMGLSQGAYAGGKWVSPKTPNITTISPKTGIKTDDTVAVRGVNFGNVKNTITVGNEKVENTDIIEWVDTGIDFKVSAKIGKMAGTQKLEVLVGGKKAEDSITIG